MPVSQTEFVGLPKLGSPGYTLLGDLDKAKRHHFADCRIDRLAMNAVVDKVLICDRQLPIVRAPMVRHFNFEPIEDLAA
jgi:hypothetical protein